MARMITLLTTAALALAIGGCDTTKKKAPPKEEVTGGFDIRRLVGISKSPPDEFAVISKESLEMPKDFAALPAPDPGATSPRAPDAISEARQALLGEDGAAQAATTRTSASEAALLSATGAPSDPNIRSVLATEEAANIANEDEYFLDSVFPSLHAYRGADTKDTIQPVEEYKRLNPTNASKVDLGARTAEIATIPSSSAPAPVTARTPATPAPVFAPAPSATQSTSTPFPSIGGTPSTDSELIYIPE